MQQGLRNRLNLLRGQPPETVENILMEALRHARREEIAPICRSLIDTGRPSALTAALRYLHRLDEPTWRALARRRGDLSTSIRSVMTGDDLRPIPNLIRLVETRGDAPLLPEVAGRLTAERGVHAKEAGRALLNVTERWLKRGQPSPDRRRALEHVDRAVTAALETWREHRRPEVLIAAALLSRHPGPRLKAMLEDHDDPVHFALRSAAEELGHPLVRRNLIRWIDSPWIGRSVTRRLHALTGADHLEDLLRDGHLLRLQTKRQALDQVDKAVRLLPADVPQLHLLPETSARLAEFIDALPAPPMARVKALGAMVRITDPRARWRAALSLTGMRHAAAECAIDAYADDPVPIVARLAARHVMTRPDEDSRSMLERLERSDHPFIARLARRRLAKMDAERFFERWMHLDPADRAAAAWKHFAMHSDQFLGRLRGALTGDHAAPAMLAIELIRRMRLAGRFEAPLTGLTFHREARIAASAVMALGESGSRHCLAAVRAALHHDDARVQANAVEALTKLHAPETSDLVSCLTGSGHNRTRANAILACMRSHRHEGECLLQSMLRDANPLHRVSAVWAVKRSRSSRMLLELKDVAAHDGSMEIRTRAKAVIRSMSAARSLIGADA